MKTVLIAGGTGLIGKRLTKELNNKGYRVYKLTRRAKKRGQIYWNPLNKTIEGKHLDKVEVIVNLVGENVGDKRWTVSRKEQLLNSRVDSTRFLYNCAKNMPKLQYYLGASGINCYGNVSDIVKTENSAYGVDFLSKLVQSWEESSQLFSDKVPIAILRIASVLDRRGGMLKKIKQPISMGLGSQLGNGIQKIPWIHIDDVVAMIVHCIEQKLEGTYNAVSSCDTNRQFMKTLAVSLKRPFIMPRVPSWLIKLIFGERSVLLLGNVNASNEKILETGFTFKFPSLAAAFRDLFWERSST